MYVFINDSCIKCGACASMCSEVFSLNGKVVVKEDAISDNESCIQEAAKACPVSAIEIK